MKPFGLIRATTGWYLMLVVRKVFPLVLVPHFPSYSQEVLQKKHIGISEVKNLPNKSYIINY